MSALEAHVLGKIFRLHQLPDVVKIGTDTAKRCISADRFARGFGQIRDYQAVMISPRRFDGHSAQQRVIQVRKLDP